MHASAECLKRSCTMMQPLQAPFSRTPQPYEAATLTEIVSVESRWTFRTKGLSALQSTALCQSSAIRQHFLSLNTRTRSSLIYSLHLQLDSFQKPPSDRFHEELTFALAPKFTANGRNEAQALASLDTLKRKLANDSIKTMVRSPQNRPSHQSRTPPLD